MSQLSVHLHDMSAQDLIDSCGDSFPHNDTEQHISPDDDPGTDNAPAIEVNRHAQSPQSGLRPAPGAPASVVTRVLSTMHGKAPSSAKKTNSSNGKAQTKARAHESSHDEVVINGTTYIRKEQNAQRTASRVKWSINAHDVHRTSTRSPPIGTDSPTRWTRLHATLATWMHLCYTAIASFLLRIARPLRSQREAFAVEYEISNQSHRRRQDGAMLDRGANGPMLGKDMRAICLTDRKVDVSGLDA